MRVAELEGELLDYWVAKAEELVIDGIRLGGVVIGITPDRYVYHPSTNWAHGGPIVERERISINYDASGRYSQGWRAFSKNMPIMLGDTPLIAAMRCYVATKYGDEVPDME